MNIGNLLSPFLSGQSLTRTAPVPGLPFIPLFSPVNAALELTRPGQDMLPLNANFGATASAQGGGLGELLGLSNNSGSAVAALEALFARRDSGDSRPAPRPSDSGAEDPGQVDQGLRRSEGPEQERRYAGPSQATGFNAAKDTGEAQASATEAAGGLVTTVSYQGPIPAALAGAAGRRQGTLDLEKVTPAMITTLTDAERQSFVTQIASRQIAYLSETPMATFMLPPTKINALQYLLDHLVRQPDSVAAVTKLLSMKPDGVELGQQTATFAVIHLQELLGDMLVGEKEGHLVNNHLRTIAQIGKSLTGGGGKELEGLLKYVQPAIANSGLSDDSQAAVIGALLSGFVLGGAAENKKPLANVLKEIASLLPVGKALTCLLKISIGAAGELASAGSSGERQAIVARMLADIESELEQEVARGRAARQAGKPLPDDEELTENEKMRYILGIQRALHANGFL